MLKNLKSLENFFSGEELNVVTGGVPPIPRSTTEYSIRYDGIAFHTPARHCGNTTRLVDLFVQQFFHNGYCLVHDHHGSRESQRRTMEMVERRLNYEHQLSLGDHYEADPDNFTIRRTGHENVNREGMEHEEYIRRQRERMWNMRNI